MFRVLGTCGLGAVFVAISPVLRGVLVYDADKIQRTIIYYSPWSYAFIGVGILGLMMFGLHRASQPRC